MMPNKKADLSSSGGSSSRSSSSESTSSRTFTDSESSSSEAITLQKKKISKPKSKTSSVTMKKTSSTSEESKTSSSTTSSSDDGSSDEDFSKKPTKMKTPIRKIETQPLPTSLQSRNKPSICTQGLSATSTSSSITPPPTVKSRGRGRPCKYSLPDPPPSIVKPRGRGRPRKYPLPDRTQPKPNKIKKITTDVTKTVTREQSQSSIIARLNILLSSIIRDFEDTDSDTEDRTVANKNKEARNKLQASHSDCANQKSNASLGHRSTDARICTDDDVTMETDVSSSSGSSSSSSSTSSSSESTSSNTSTDSESSSSEVVTSHKKRISKPRSKTSSVTMKKTSSTFEESETSSISSTTSSDDSSDEDFLKKPTKAKTPIRKIKTQPLPTSLPSRNKSSISTCTQGLSATSTSSVITPPPTVKPRGRGRPRKYPLPDPPPPIVKQSGRGRLRKYPLPDPTQPKPNKIKKITTDVTKTVTREQSQSFMSSPVSTLLSSINRDVIDTDSNTTRLQMS